MEIAIRFWEVYIKRGGSYEQVTLRQLYPDYHIDTYFLSCGWKLQLDFERHILREEVKMNKWH